MENNSSMNSDGLIMSPHVVTEAHTTMPGRQKALDTPQKSRKGQNRPAESKSRVQKVSTQVPYRDLRNLGSQEIFLEEKNMLSLHSLEQKILHG